MSPIAIVQKSRHLGTCRSCGAAVEWAIVEKSGRRMPFDVPIVTIPQFDEDAPVVLVDPEKTTSHFASCPQATSWRKCR